MRCWHSRRLGPIARHVLEGLTQAAGRFVAELAFDAIPGAALSTAEAGFCDCVAAMLASAQEPAVFSLLQVVESYRSGVASVLLGARRTSTEDAALINGTAAHAQDFDDIGLGSHPAHPSAVMVPAILALAECTNANGRDMLSAYVAGYEVWGECARRDADHLLEKGWHATGVLGPLASAAAAARLLRLGPERAATALAIASSQASGLMANFGSMTKPLHAGLASRAGVFAARLASAGFTAGGASLEGPGGLLQAISPKGRVDVAPPQDLGLDWNIIRLPLGIKQYPVCYAMHRAVDGAIALHRTLSGRLDEIDRVDVTIGALQLKMLTYSRPENGLQAKFSLEFGVATGLLEGSLGLQHLRFDHLARPDLRLLMEKIHVVEDSRTDPVYRVFSPLDIVEVVLRNGSRHRQSVDFPNGHPERPLSSDDRRRKFMACTVDAFESSEATRCFDLLSHLRTLVSTDSLPRSHLRHDGDAVRAKGV